MEAYFLIGTLVALAVSASVIFYFWKGKNQLYQELEFKKVEIGKSERARKELEKELHHRVKNNMQIISSILQLKAKNAKNVEVQEALKESQFRMQSMQVAHQKIITSSDRDHLNLLDYCRDLTSILRHAILDIECRLSVQGSSFTINLEQAQAVGFVLHELIANSAKYAWDESETHKCVHISVSMEEGYTKVKYKDNGKGLPEGFEIEKASSFGMNFMRAVVQRQLIGKLSYSFDLGTEFLITFKRR